MGSKALIELALKTLDINQKQLASHLHVSPTQITKWKNDEHISFEMQKKFESILDLQGIDPEFATMIGSIESAKVWDKIIKFLAKFAREESETGYDTVPLIDELNFLVLDVGSIMQDIGLSLPQTIPVELQQIDFDNFYGLNEDDDINIEKNWFILQDNIYTSTIEEMLLNLNDVYGYYAAYISKLFYSPKFKGDLEIDELDFSISSSLLSLAATNLENIDTPEFKDFRYKTLKSVKELMLSLKNKCIEQNIPLGVELMDFVNVDHGQLGHETEAESLGFNDYRVHPDIYMSEILIGLRNIERRQLLIMEKLGIEDNPFV